MAAGGGRTFLEEISSEFSGLAASLAQYAEADARRRKEFALARVTARQVQAVLVARQVRSEAFRCDLGNPGWSLLLELFRAGLEKRELRLSRLATDAGVALTTALRWLDTLVEAGFVRREPDPNRHGSVLVALTEAGMKAMEDYFVTIDVVSERL